MVASGLGGRLVQGGKNKRALAKAMTALRPMPMELPAAGGRVHRHEILRAWGYRIGLGARDALGAATRIDERVGDREGRVSDISAHYGLKNVHHCFHVEPLRWLRLSETQATNALKLFLSSSDERVSLFLWALAPCVHWPNDLRDFTVEAETRAGRGRIDLLISGKNDNGVWGAVIEAKFEHRLSANPLGDYRRHGARLQMRFGSTMPRDQTGVLIVLGKKRDRRTCKKLARNAHWRFVHWHEVLRRFDAQLIEPELDVDFQRFRRTLWDRVRSDL